MRINRTNKQQRKRSNQTWQFRLYFRSNGDASHTATLSDRIVSVFRRIARIQNDAIRYAISSVHPFDSQGHADNCVREPRAISRGVVGACLGISNCASLQKNADLIGTITALVTLQPVARVLGNPSVIKMSRYLFPTGLRKF